MGKRNEKVPQGVWVAHDFGYYAEIRCDRCGKPIKGDGFWRYVKSDNPHSYETESRCGRCGK